MSDQGKKLKKQFELPDFFAPGATEADFSAMERQFSEITSHCDDLRMQFMCLVIKETLSLATGVEGMMLGMEHEYDHDRERDMPMLSVFMDAEEELPENEALAKDLVAKLHLVIGGEQLSLLMGSESYMITADNPDEGLAKLMGEEVFGRWKARLTEARLQEATRPAVETRRHKP